MRNVTLSRQTSISEMRQKKGEKYHFNGKKRRFIAFGVYGDTLLNPQTVASPLNGGSQ
jgi:hypothetical protein